MKIKRQSLIELLQTRLDEREKYRLNRHANALQSHDEAEVEYVTQTHAAWLDFAEQIRTTVMNGGIPRPSDIPKAISDGSLRGGLKFFSKNPPLLPTASEEELNLRRLIEVLKNSTDDEVSTYALEKMGFTLGRILK